MSAHYHQQPLVRMTILVTPEHRAALAAEAAVAGRPMCGIFRDMLDQRYYDEPKIAPAGWRITTEVRPRIDPAAAPPAERARLREWISRLGRRR